MKTPAFIKHLREAKLMLPPLTGFTDYPYRVILSDFNPPCLTTEMINARALLHKNHRTLMMIKRIPESIFQGVQLLGKDAVSMAHAAEIVKSLGFDYIDINMGCTIKKVVSRGEGVALMGDEQRACDVLEAVCGAVDLPVTVKLRIGLSKKKINVLRLSGKLVDAGAVALVVHGRSGEKKFSSMVELDVISGVVGSVSVPVFANGGVFSGDDAEKVLAVTGAAGVMPGRGLIGNPWLVSEILCRFSGKKFLPPSLYERKNVCEIHTKELCDFYGERRGVLLMRKILPRYFSSTVHIKELKHDVQSITKKSDVYVILNHILENGSQWFYKKINC